MRSSWIPGIVAALVLSLSCGTTESKETLCFDGKDDDGNGKIDCADSACAAVAGCSTGGDGGDGGGTPCSDQLTCLGDKEYDQYPLSVCVSGKCRETEDIEIKMTVNGSAYAGSVPFKSMSTRIISKTAVDGSSVTCDTLQQNAPGKTAAEADQLATSKKFNLWAHDVLGLTVTAGQSWNHSRMHTNTGANFLIWIEIWSGAQNAEGLPTGNRLGWTCIDDEPTLTADDDINDGSGRNVQVELANPQG